MTKEDLKQLIHEVYEEEITPVVEEPKIKVKKPAKVVKK